MTLAVVDNGGAQQGILYGPDHSKAVILVFNNRTSFRSKNGHKSLPVQIRKEKILAATHLV